MLARLRWRFSRDGGGGDGGSDGDGDGDRGDRAAFLAYFTGWVLDNIATHLPFVVEVDGRAAGMAWLALSTRVPSASRLDRRTGDVQSVFVVPELRNQGVGAALIEAILRDARNRELELVTVHSSRGAVTLYLRSGFRDGQRWFEWRP